MAYRVVSNNRLELEPTYPRGSFLGNVFRAVTGTVGGAIGGFISGGVPGAIGGALGGATKATISNLKSDANEAAKATAPPLTVPSITRVTSSPIPMMTMPGGGIVTQSPLGTPVSPAAIARQQAALTSGGHARGTHPNKTWSYSRKTGQLAAPGSKLVSNRRMNWSNGRALGRAERRIRSAVTHMTKYIRWVHPSRAGHAAPKFKKASRR